MRCGLAVGSCEEFLAAVDEDRAPDLVLMDIGLPGRASAACAPEEAGAPALGSSIKLSVTDPRVPAHIHPPRSCDVNRHTLHE